MLARIQENDTNVLLVVVGKYFQSVKFKIYWSRWRNLLHKNKKHQNIGRYRMFIATLFVVTKSWTQTYCVVSSYLNHNQLTISINYQEGEASIWVICLHDSVFLEKYTISTYVNISLFTKYLLSTYNMPGTILWCIHSSGREINKIN